MNRVLCVIVVAFWAVVGCNRGEEPKGGEVGKEGAKAADGKPDAGRVTEAAVEVGAKKEPEAKKAEAPARSLVPGEVKVGEEGVSGVVPLSAEEKKRLEKMPKGGLPAPDDDVVAWSEGRRVSSDSLRRYLQRLPAHLRTEYATVEKKMDMLRNLIRLELLVELATKEGMDKDPDVIMAMKMEMAKKFLMKRFGDESLVTVTDAEIEARYQKNSALYNKPEKVRASQIVVADRATADKVVAEMRVELEKPEATIKRVFREFVRKHSIDEKTRRRGGDLLYFERDGKTDGDTALDPAVVDAAFATTTLDQLSSVIEGRDGSFYLLMVTSRRDGVSRPLSEVTGEIRREVAQEKLEAERKHFADTMVDFDAWTFDQSRIAAVLVEGAPSAGNIGARIEASEGAGAMKQTPPGTPEPGVAPDSNAEPEPSAAPAPTPAEGGTAK